MLYEVITYCCPAAPDGTLKLAVLLTELPMPPNTAAVKAFKPGKKPMKKKTPWGRNKPLNIPAAPANAPPSAKVVTIILSMLALVP